MRYCVHCGAPLEAGQRFCSSCGRPAEPPAAPAGAAVTAPAPAPVPGYAAPPPPPAPAPPYGAPPPPLPPRRRSGGRPVAVVLLALAVVGAGVGAFALVRHLTAPDAAPAAASTAASTAATTPATTSAAPTTSTSAPASPTSDVPTGATAAPTDDATAATALRHLAAQDRPSVLALHGAWTVQLTSKTDGTVDASGRVWRWLDIWNLHQQLLATYPDALLVDTGEWGSYQLAGYYATITGETFPNKAATLAWCRGEHLDRDSCAGKRVRVDGDYRTDIALQPER